MTYLSGMLGLVAIAVMATLILLAVRRDRDLRRNAPDKVVAASAAGAGMGSAVPGPAVPGSPRRYSRLSIARPREAGGGGRAVGSPRARNAAASTNRLPRDRLTRWRAAAA